LLPFEGKALQPIQADIPQMNGVDDSRRRGSREAIGGLGSASAAGDGCRGGCHQGGSDRASDDDIPHDQRARAEIVGVSGCATIKVTATAAGRERAAAVCSDRWSRN